MGRWIRVYTHALMGLSRGVVLSSSARFGEPAKMGDNVRRLYTSDGKSIEVKCSRHIPLFQDPS